MQESNKVQEVSQDSNCQQNKEAFYKFMRETVFAAVILIAFGMMLLVVI